MAAPVVVREAAALPALLAGARVALVPTMGALHEGHLSLVRLARRAADVVVVSIYVNPLQFGTNEDFSEYPRQLAADCAQLSGLADIVFAPEDLYPVPQTVGISLPPLAGELCGRFRPGFFEGVATVVCKLFNCVRPQIAVFGQKDFQQTHLIRLLAAQLNFPVTVMAAPIVREPDGLAMSSRNAYLSAQERQRAVLLPQTLQRAAAAVESGTVPAAVAAAAAVALTAGGFAVDYVEARDTETLGAAAAGGIVLLAAARLEKTRLIDNVQCHSPGGGKEEL